MNSQMIFGGLLLVMGITIVVVSQILLHTWIKKFNKEWIEGKDEMS